MGFVQNSIVVANGANLAIAGKRPTGLAAQGKVIWKAAQPWTLVNSTFVSNIATVGSSTPAIDTTGANLIAIVKAVYLGNVTITDSQANSWTTGVSAGYGGVGGYSEIEYCINPITSSAHIFSSTATNNAASIIVLCFHLPAAISVGAQTSTGSGVVTPPTIPLSPLTPTADSLVLSASTAAANILSIDSGFTVVKNIPFVPSYSGAGAVAYLVMQSSATVAPVWTLASSSSTYHATMMYFKPS